jgi:hypothetical protein
VGIDINVTERTGTDATAPETQAAVAASTDDAARTARPEEVVAEPPPPPDYPRYRVDPGDGVRLADVDPDESEHYHRKKDVAEELDLQRKRIGDLQAKLYGEQHKSLLLVLPRSRRTTSSGGITSASRLAA